MSERERWVVYPLLFLTLGVAMRDKMLKRVDTDAIAADRVISSPLTVSHTLRADEVICGRLIVQSQSGRPAVAIAEDSKSRLGIVETYGTDGQLTGLLGVGPIQVLPKWMWPRLPSTQPPANRYQQQPTRPPAEPDDDP